MTIIFNDTLGAYGGGQTLMLRICTWMEHRGYRTVIFCSSDSNSEIVKKLENNNTLIECFNLFDVKKMRDMLKKYIIQDEIKVINLSWNYYLDMEVTKKLYNLEFDNFLYCIHHETFKKGKGFKFRFMREYSIKNYKNIFERMNLNNAIMMMDEVYLEEGENYLNVKLLPKPAMIRLPVICNPVIDREKVIRNGYNNKVIMTAARAEFPFKGYMVGLVDDFVKLKSKYIDLKLEIVSDGEDIEELLQKVDNIPESMKKDVILHRWLDYETLKKETENCYLFIGTGTTILDAALKYKPSIPVVYGIYDVYAKGTLSERPEEIFPPLDCKDKAIEIMDHILGYDFDKYQSECEKSYDSVKRTYNIDNIIPEMIRCTNVNKKSLLTKKECIRHIMNNKINEIRYRNKNKFDYKKLKVETRN